VLHYDILIVGSGQAGARAAESMRKAGFSGTLAIFGDERHLPYERPPLSKEILSGTQSVDTATILPGVFFSDAQIDICRGVRIDRLDAAQHRVYDTDGRAIQYGKLLLCTGGRVRTLPVAAQGQRGVFYLRTMDDAVSLSKALKPGSHVTVIGAGFLGLEIAATARKLGVAVTVVEAASGVLERNMAPQIASRIEGFHRQNGVDFFLGTTVTGIRETPYGWSILELSNGQLVGTDSVVVTIGIVPNVELAERAGAAVENGSHYPPG
jgi:3-phenylpropionate/trans-cinnamate dioxygenase ferredoxin reductase subunit